MTVPKKIIGIIKRDFMAEHLYWTALDCTVVPNKVDIGGIVHLTRP